MMSYQSACAWIDENVAALGGEMVPLAAAAGRVLAADLPAPADLPDRDRAAADGLAVCAAETSGASAYNPLGFRPPPLRDEWPPFTGRLLQAGAEMPVGADAVVPLVFVETAAAGRYEIIQPVPRFHLVGRRASACGAGAVLFRRGRVLAPPDLGLLALTGIEAVPAVRRPRISCLMAGPEAGPDADSLLLAALIARDGGIAAQRLVGRDRVALAQALAQADVDAVIITGGTGAGANDAAAVALAQAGTLAQHGIAIRPGETAGFGRNAAGVPVFLLPGTPVDCLWAYELLGGGAIRRLGGRSAALPYPTRRMQAARKFVSAIGLAEVIPFACRGGDLVQPLAFAELGLAAAVAADGFVIIPAACEGFAAGAEIPAHLYREPPGLTV